MSRAADSGSAQAPTIGSGGVPVAMADVAAPTKAPGRRLVGTDLPRKEDDRLLRGAGQFTDDVGRAHTLHMAVARCPYPHAAITNIDAAAALELDGVVEVMVGEEAARRANPISIIRPLKDAPKIPNYALALGVATYEGQPVVSVVATSRHIAEDAVALIEIDYEPLPHVSDVDSALADGAPVLQPSTLDSNLLVVNPEGRGDVDARFAEADVVVEGRFTINRVTAAPMETHAVLAEWQPGAGFLTVHLTTQWPHLVRTQLAESLRINESEVRLIVDEIGGGFGQKTGLFAEDVIASLHAMSLCQPVKFVEDRTEHFRASTHARESVHHYRIGARSDGRIIAMSDIYMNDIGGLNAPVGSSQMGSVVFCGPYKVHDGYVERRAVLTNKTPIGGYRGFGIPEVNFAYEQLMDRLARRLGMDPVELRAMNMVAPEDFPWTNPSGAIYDSGEYARCLRMAADAVGWDEHRARPRRPRPSDGRLVGVGLASYVERTGFAGNKFLAARQSNFGAHESVIIRANRSGTLDVYTAVTSIGNGSQTVFAQMTAEFFGCDYDAVSVHVGDTASAPQNTGSASSRVVIAASGALRDACLEVRAKVLRIAAHMLEVPEIDQLEVAGPVVQHRDDPSLQIALSDIFRRAIVGQGLPPGELPGLEATSYFEPKHASFGYGTGAAIVSVDAESGEFDVERFVMVHDCGTPVNPMLVEGQVRGAMAQGFGQAMFEELRYDPETGQLLNGTMMDYFIPTAADLPPVELQHLEVPSPVTTMGVRGVGEAGTIPIGAAIANALSDALMDFGVEFNSLPITPESVWRALQQSAETSTRGPQA